MKDEIKELIDLLEYDVKKEFYFEITPEDSKLLLDYITNLQNENMKYDQCLTELTDNYKDLQKELTNLQEENKILKEQQQELERYKNIIDELEKWLEEQRKYYKNYDCQKEIKYEFLRISTEYMKILNKLEELKGSDK